MAYNLISVIIGLSLIFLSWIDLKKKEIPSFLTTTIIFIVCILKIENFEYGLYAILFAVMLWELNYIKGLADIKIIALIGITLNSFNQFAMMMIFIVGFGFIWQVILAMPIFIKNENNKKILNKIKEIEVPFIPVLTAVYFVLKLTF